MAPIVPEFLQLFGDGTGTSSELTRINLREKVFFELEQFEGPNNPSEYQKYFLELLAKIIGDKVQLVYSALEQQTEKAIQSILKPDYSTLETVFANLAFKDLMNVMNLASTCNNLGSEYAQNDDFYQSLWYFKVFFSQIFSF